MSLVGRCVALMLGGKSPSSAKQHRIKIETANLQVHNHSAEYRSAFSCKIMAVDLKR
jgi:hypothetical protein